MPKLMVLDQRIADIICQRLEAGESLRSICKGGVMPSKTTVLKWLREDEAFAAQYTQARARQAELYAEDIVRIADEEPDHNRARLMIDARKWTASKLLPKKYGDKLELGGTGAGGAIVVQLTPDDLKA